MWKEFLPSQLGNDLLAFTLLSYIGYVSVHLLGTPGHFDQQVSVLMGNGGRVIPPGGSALCCHTAPLCTNRAMSWPKHHLRGAGRGFFVLTTPSEQLLLLWKLIL